MLNENQPWLKRPSQSSTPPVFDLVFEAKRQDWIRCLDCKDAKTGQLDCNCILAQVYKLIWDAAAFRVVLRARQLTDTDVKDRLKLHGLMHRLLDRCFYHSQLVSIRRLMDTYSLGGNRGVFSLKSLVLDMKGHRVLFTRRNLFAAFSLEIDLARLEEAEAKYHDERLREGVRSYGIPREVDASVSRRVHEEIDSLCGVTADIRSPADTVSEVVFDRLESRLAETESICDHVNKYLAHAATPESRLLVDADSTVISFADLWKAHEIICRTCQFIDCYLLRQTGHGFLPYCTDDLFQYVDQPLATIDTVPELRKTWDDFEAETENWAEGCMEWICIR